MCWMKRKNSRKKKGILAVGMAWILLFQMLNPVLASEEYIGSDLSSDLIVENGVSEETAVSPELAIFMDEQSDYNVPEDIDEIVEISDIEEFPENNSSEGNQEEFPENNILEGSQEEFPENNILEGSQEELPEDETSENSSDEVSVVNNAFILASEEVMLNADTAEDGIALFSASSLASSTKVTFQHNFDTTVLPSVPGSGANQWQIMKGSYAGHYDGTSDVSQGFDAASNASYSADGAVRLTKNVVSTDTENEFQMYLNVEPQVSWEEVLQLNTIMVTNANKDVVPPNWPEAGQPSYIKPEKDNDYDVPVQLRYYAMQNGQKITIAEVIMYANTQKVPNGAYGIGNPLLESSGGTFQADNNFNLKENGNESVSTAEIDISSIYNKYEFSTKKVKPQRVTDQMGEHIVLDTASFNYDGGSVSETNGTITWNLPTNDLGLLPYRTETKKENGLTVEMVVPVGVKRSLPNGKVTYYRQEAYQLSYCAALAVEDQTFISCGSADSSNDCNADYAVQTNISPDTPQNQEYGGTVTYVSDGVLGTAYFKSPYIKGLLYDLEFQKVLENSSVPLEGITFTVERSTGTGSHAQQVVFTAQQISDKDGWVKFHDMPWGEYTIKEIAYQNDNSFQNQYLKQDLPKELDIVMVGQTANGSALRNEHYGLHSCDLERDLRNQLFIYHQGIVGNAPYRAKITIRKVIDSYDSVPEAIRSAAFTMKTNSTDIFRNPQESAKTMEFLETNEAICHQETLTYDLIVPVNGGTLTLEEVIPEEYRNKFVFSSAKAEANAGSTELGTYTDLEQGCSLQVLPGNDITITVTNIPVGKVYIKKMITNYEDKLAKDAFIIQAVSADDGGKKVNTQVVLNAGQTSAPVMITSPVVLELTEILPKEYSLSQIQISGGGQLYGNRLTVNPGEEVTVTICNTHTEKSYFHVSDAVRNIFS